MARGGATKRHEPTDATRKEVETFAGYGTPQTDIALKMGMSVPTLVRHYKHELKLGKIKANALVAESLFARAIDKAHPQGVASAIFWMKAQAGWSERQRIEVTGKDGGPVQHQVLQLDLSRLTDDELAIFQPLFEKVAVQAVSAALGEGAGGAASGLPGGVGQEEEEGGGD